MNNNSTAESLDATQREAFAAELEMAFNFAKFAAAASDPELAHYVHAKARDSYQRLAKWSSGSQSAERTQGALHTLQQRLADFQAALPTRTASKSC